MTISKYGVRAVSKRLPTPQNSAESIMSCQDIMMPGMKVMQD